MKTYSKEELGNLKSNQKTDVLDANTVFVKIGEATYCLAEVLATLVAKKKAGVLGAIKQKAVKLGATPKAKVVTKKK